MKRRTQLLLTTLCIVLASCAPTRQATQTAVPPVSEQQQEEISEIILEMPAADETMLHWLNERLIGMAPGSIHALAGRLAAPGTGDDTYARYAVNGLAKYVSRTGNESWRATYEQAILAELAGNHPAPVKSFLMEQLELIGSDNAVPVLSSMLGHTLLHDSAVHALRAIGTPGSAEVLAQSLNSGTDAQRIATVKALGDMEAAPAGSVNRISGYTGSGNAELREASLYMLAASGAPEAAAALTDAGEARHLLHYADRLGENGQISESGDQARAVYSGDYPVHYRITALSLMAEYDPTGSADRIVDAATGSNPELRNAALEIVEHSENEHWISSVAGQLNTAAPDVQVDILAMLGRLGEGIAWSEVEPLLRSDNTNVRMAAITAAPALGGSRAAYRLVYNLDRAEQQEIEVIKNALLRLPSGPLYQEASQSWPSLSSRAKVALIEIVAARKSNAYLDELLAEMNNSGQSVRMAVLNGLQDMARYEDLSKVVRLLASSRTDRETAILQRAVAVIINDASGHDNAGAPLLSALESASGRRAVNLIPVLPRIGGPEALGAAVEAVDSDDEEVREAGVRALANWPASSAIEPLQEAILAGSDATELIEAYVDMVLDSRYTDEDKVAYLVTLLDEFSDSDRIESLFNGLSDIQAPSALRAVSGYFNASDSTVREAALRAAAEILAPGYDFAHDFDGSDQTLAVLHATADPSTRQAVEQYISEIQTEQESSEGFRSLFNGEDLSGWTGATDAYIVRDGQLIHRDGESGNLFTRAEYSDFILRFQFKLTPGANNGLAIRSPLEGDPAYQGIELQILDNTAEEYADLEPYQYHGSAYGIAAAERGHLKPTGEWNTQEVIANGSQITVKLNGVTILDTDIQEAASPETADGREHPGLQRSGGHIGFLGHGDEVAFRNIQVQDLNVFYPDYSMGSEEAGGMNHPPEGFKALFNGENLDGWNGLVENPEVRAEMSSDQLAREQLEANRVMEQHWSVRDGILFFDGEGESLTTVKKYKDFEMMLDWKIEPGGDSGVYLRGSPQVQIWDVTEWPQGSGGLYNNQNNLSEPIVSADNPVGEWNRMRIKMIGERVTVHLNGQLVVPDVVLENYWNREIPIYSEGQIELQAHSTPLYFKNVFIREIPRTEPLFNGQDLSGWQRVGGDAGSWNADDGILFTSGDGEEWERGMGGGWLSTTEQYDNFRLELEYRLPEGGNSGIFIRAPHQGDPAFEGLEIQLLDDYAAEYAGLEPWQYTGSIYDLQAPSQQVSKRAGEWQKIEVVADGPEIKVTLNGSLILNTSLIRHQARTGEHPGVKRRSGYIGLQNHNSRVEFRNISITEIK